MKRYRIVFQYLETGKVVRAGSSSNKERQENIVKQQNERHKGKIKHWIEVEDDQDNDFDNYTT